MQLFDGVKAEVLFNKRALKVSPQGILTGPFPFQEKGKPIIRVTVDNSAQGVCVVEVTKNKNVAIAAQMQTGDTTRQRAYYRSVGIGRLNSGLLHTMYSTNNLRVLRLKQDKGELWEVSLTFQNGQAFFLSQIVYVFGLAFSNGKIHSPTFMNWPQMVDFINEQYTGDRTQLPSTVARPHSFSLNGEIGRQGKVLWYSEASQTGALLVKINGESKQVKVHWSNIISKKAGRATLEPGARVRYRSLQTFPSGGFTHQAVGVEFIR